MSLIEERKAKLFSILKSFSERKQSNLLYLLGLIGVISLALWIRTQNLGNLAGKYLIELDSYFFYRLAKTIVETGTLPEIDIMRYAPIGYQTAPYKFFALTMAKLYEFVHIFFPNVTQIEWHIYYPPVITAISFIFLFLLLREIFDSKVALISTALLAVIPAYIQRTSAGFADHEAIAILWMFLSLWLFVVMWKSDNLKKILPIAIASGIFAGFMVMSWGGFRFLTLTIGLFFIITQLFPKVNTKQVIGYIAWLIPFFIAWSIQFYQGFSFGIFTNIENIIMLAGPMLYLTILILRKTKVYDHTYKYLPIELVSLILVIIAGLSIGGLLGFININTLIEPLLSISESATEFTRFGLTVSESQNPYFYGSSGWWQSFSYAIIFGFLGSSLMVYKLFELKLQDGKLIDKLKQNKAAIAATLIYAIFFLVFILARLSDQAKHEKIVSFFAGTYVYWVFIVLFSFLGLYIYIYKKNNAFAEIFSGEKSLLLLIFILFMLSFLTSRGQIRILFMFAPVICIAAGYFISNSLTFLSRGNKFLKVLAIVLAVLVVFSFYSAAATSLQINKYTGSMIPGQWEQSMIFLRDSTPKGSVVTHWWDYGYMTQTVGERPSVTDGGNVRPWNHASGRYFLTGKDETQTLEYLKTHNVSYILISKEELPKYHAFSFIGSDENLDRRSTIGTFVLNEQREIRDGNLLIYTGGWSLDKDYILGDKILSPGNSGIIAFSLNLINNQEITEPKAYLVRGSENYQAGISCIYANGQKLTFPVAEPSIPGCLVIVPYYNSETDARQIGGAFWLSEKVYDTNFARLYIYGENDPNFKLVYSDSVPLGYYQGQLIGPIKIWEVNYPSHIKADPKYMEESRYG